VELLGAVPNFLHRVELLGAVPNFYTVWYC